MQNIKLLLPVLSIFLLVVTGCQKEMSTKDNAAVAPLEGKMAASSSTGLKERMAQWRASASIVFAQKRKQHPDLPSAFNTEPWSKLRQTLNTSESTPCNNNTPIRQWLDNELADWSQEDFDLAEALSLAHLSSSWVYWYEHNTASQYFGVDGDYTQQVKRTFKDLNRFWGFPSGDVQAVADHGNILLDTNKLATIFRGATNTSDEEARARAQLIADVVKNHPRYRQGDHPYFTFGSGYFFQQDNTSVGDIPHKIIIGDGILEGFAALGYGDVAPQALLAHEFSHFVQFRLEIFANVPDAEVTRRVELMADAFAGYYLSHARGAAMQWKRVKQFLQVFFNIGDCYVDNTTHQGTPPQRMAAAEWAYNLANKAQKQGHILSAEEFVVLFDAALPQIVSH